MSYHSYTVLECTKPELISSGSTFVKESNSKLLQIVNGKSHFLTWKNTMDAEIIRLSTRYPDETFNARCHWDDDIYDRIIYHMEYKNGKCRETAREPGYVFVCYEKEIPDAKILSDFREHVLQYLKRLDIVKGIEEGFRIDKLNNEKDENGYESYITITYENDLYRLTATKKWISYVEISVEKKEPEIDILKEIENRVRSEVDGEYNELPF